MEGNLLKWYFVIHSLKDDDYKGGVYLGKIIFPSEYPMKPPDIQFITPNGRFELKKKICLSFTSYHPETWSAAWTVQNMLIGLISFMLTNEAATGTVSTSSFEKRKLARESVMYNMQLDDFTKAFKQDLDNLGINLNELLDDKPEIIEP